MALRKFIRHSLWLWIAAAALPISSNRLCSGDETIEGGAENVQAVEVQHEATPLSELPTNGGVEPVAADAKESCTQAAATGCANGACVARPNPNSCGAGVGVARCTPGGVVAGDDPCRGRRMYGWGPQMSPDVGGYTLRDAGHSMNRAGQSMNRNAWNWRDPANSTAGDWNEWCDECNHRRSRCDECPKNGGWCRKCGRWCCDGGQMFLARNRQTSAILRAHFCGKLAYFTPMGNGGQGVPPFGSYHLVYAANPQYMDPRDAQVYAAQGWGAPISVPLAPHVRHTMNYSTGIPSSRLTPISNVVPSQPRYVQPW